MWAAGNAVQFFNGNACLAGCKGFSSSPLCTGNGDCIAITGVNWINTPCAAAGTRPARTVVIVEAPTTSSGGLWAALDLDSNASDSNYDLDFKKAGASSIASPYIGGVDQLISILGAEIAGSTLTVMLGWTGPAGVAEALNNSGASLVRSYSVFFARSTGGVPPAGTGTKTGWTRVDDTDIARIGGYSTDAAATVAINLAGSSEKVFVAVGLNFDGTGNPVSDPTTKESSYISRATEVCVLASPPVTPALTAPPSAASGEVYSVSWTATSADNTYEVQESTDPGFAGASTVAVMGTSANFNHTVGSDTTYYYRVRAKVMCDATPNDSAWSTPGQTLVTPAAGCTVVLSEQTIISTQTYTSCGTLTAGPAFRVEAPGNVTLRAAEQVILTNGFSVGAAATFRAGIDPSLAP